jgi:hypothetical protein
VYGKSPLTLLLWLVKDFITTRIFAAMTPQRSKARLLLSLFPNTIAPGNNKKIGFVMKP